MLYFQKEGGTNTVYANLGNAATLYRGASAGPGAANKVDFLDINTALVSAFGAGWASDPSIYSGLAAVWGTSNTSSVMQDGDPHRTLYVSSPRTDVGTIGAANSTGWDLGLAGNNAMTSGASGILGQNNAFEVNYTSAVVSSPTSISFIDNQNPFSSPGVQGNAFQGAFAGGVQQVGTAGTFGSFGAAGTVEFALDLIRILARNDISGQVGGGVRFGSYEGTVTVNGSGKVSFISQGAAPTSTYDAWVSTFNPPLTNPSDRLPEADPDNDGYNNLLEFVLNGDPGVSGQSIAPTLSLTPTDFVFTFTRRDDSVAEVPVLFQYGSDLVGWTDVPVATSGTIGAATVVVAPGGAVTDGVTVTVPKTAAVGGKFFGRLKIVK